MHRLTAIETDVLAMICGGLSYAEIAARRGRSRHTVKQEAYTIHGKLNVHGNAEACAIFARAGGLVEPSVPPPEGEAMRATQV
jgi:DNA-binding CsgD family transcriptional regulator